MYIVFHSATLFMIGSSSFLEEEEEEEEEEEVYLLCRKIAHRANVVC